MLPRIGTEIFPDTDARLLRIRLRAPTGTRVEETERITLRALDVIKQEVGPDKLEITSDFVGVVPSSYPVDLIHLFTSGPQEAIIQFALKPGAPHGEDLREHLRANLAKELPGTQVSFEAGDIVSQVMSFGSPTPIEVTVLGGNLQNDYTFAQQIQIQMAALPFLRDLQIAQDVNYPTLDIDINRERAGQFGLTMADVTRSVVPATSSSRFTQPNYWRDPNSGNAFQIQVELPQNRMQSAEELGALAVMQEGRPDLRLDDIATLKSGTMPGLIERNNGQRVISLTANLHGMTLGDAEPKLAAAVARAGTPPRGVTVGFRGELPALDQTSAGLRTGLAVGDSGNLSPARGQLPVDPPCARNPAHRSSGLVRRPVDAAPDQHHAQPPVLHGSDHGGRHRSCEFDSVSQLRRAFANCRSLSLATPRATGASGRLRAILMTATAMIFGMIPMAMGYSEGGSPSTPLGRAVIGGLILSTFATLTILPSIYAILQSKASVASVSLNPTGPHEPIL